MFLDTITRRNPDLIRAAAALHQEGVIPPNSYVIDLDAIRHNAEAMAAEAERVGISLYQMTKHYNRNPLVTHTAISAGIGSTVAVDVQCAQNITRYDLPLGHVGHLVQIPRTQLRSVLRARPEVVTVFSVEKARHVSDAAEELGIVQDLLIRVRSETDIIYPNEEGGIWHDDLEQAVREIDGMGGVRIAGVTTFPGTLFNPETKQTETTVNFDNMLRSAEKLRSLGCEIEHINTPGASNARGFEAVAKAGGTHAEPGHSLTGTTPAQLYDESAPERSAIVYVNEISHTFENKGFVFGGGFYACDTGADRGDDSRYHTKPWVPHAYVGRSGDDILDTKVPVDKQSFFARADNATDYYGGTLIPEERVDMRVGDSVVYGFRPQVFTTRANVAIVDRVDSEPRLVGLFDRGNNLVDENGHPLEDATARARDLMGTLATS
jgi:predicted amino acid racemase